MLDKKTILQRIEDFEPRIREIDEEARKNRERYEAEKTRLDHKWNRIMDYVCMYAELLKELPPEPTEEGSKESC